jgi:hypothetical protein
MIIDKSFELNYVDKGTSHNGIDTNKINFKPFWEVQYLNNGLMFCGTKKECINWIAEFYYDYYDEISKSEIEAEKKALKWVKKCIKETNENK